MAWVRLDEDFAQHPKVLRAGPLAMAMQVAALCYCNRNLTDGFIPRGAARTLLDWQIVDKNGTVHELAYTSGTVGNDVTSDWVIELLVDAELWDEQPNGYQIHDYLDYQPSKSSVTKQREGTKARVRKWRENKQEIKKQEGNGVTNGSETPAPDTDTEVSTSSLRSDDADASIPLGFLKPIDGDWTAILFGQCLRWLASVYEEKPGKLRSLIGLWRKSCGDDDEKLVGLIADCQREDRADPKAWITACLQEREHGANRSGARPNKAERAKAAVGRAAVAGGYAGAEPGGETGAGDDAVSVLPKPEIVRKGAGGA